MGEGGGADMNGFHFSGEILIMVKKLDFVMFGKLFGALAFDIADPDEIDFVGELFAQDFQMPGAQMADADNGGVDFFHVENYSPSPCSEETMV